jgi:hypothetical protein
LTDRPPFDLDAAFQDSGRHLGIAGRPTSPDYAAIAHRLVWPQEAAETVGSGPFEPQPGMTSSEAVGVHQTPAVPADVRKTGSGGLVVAQRRDAPLRRYADDVDRLLRLAKNLAEPASRDVMRPFARRRLLAIVAS